MSTTFYVGLLTMHLLSLTQLHTSCHIGTLPWELIIHNFQQSSTCSNDDKTNSIKYKQRMLIQVIIFRFELNLSMDNTKSNRDVR